MTFQSSILHAHIPPRRHNRAIHTRSRASSRTRPLSIRALRVTARDGADALGAHVLNNRDLFRRLDAPFWVLLVVLVLLHSEEFAEDVALLGCGGGVVVALVAAVTAPQIESCYACDGENAECYTYTNAGHGTGAH